VVVASLGETTSNTWDQVILAISRDGGGSWPTALVVNSTVGTGAPDVPDVTIDPVDGSVWVAWSNLEWPSQSSYVRGGSFDSSGNFSWFDAGHQITPETSVHTNTYPRIQTFVRRSGSTIVGRTIAVLYSTTNQTNMCPTSSTFSFAYRVAVSENNGTTWDTFQVGNSISNWKACVLNNGSLLSLARAGFALDTCTNCDYQGSAYLAALTVPTVVSGTTVGSHIEVWRLPTHYVSLGTRTWSQVLSVSPPTGVMWQFDPELASQPTVDHDLALVYQQSDASTNNMFGAWATGTHASTQNVWAAPLRITPTDLTPVASRINGDYLDAVAIPPANRDPAVLPSPGGPVAPAPRAFRGFPGAYELSWGTGLGKVANAGFTAP
jgi:hypothetical protein